METNKLVKSKDGSYFSCERFREIHERLVEKRSSRLFWKTTEYTQLYSLLLRGSKPSNKVKQSLFHSKDFIAGRIVPQISHIPSNVEAEFPLYGLLRCWVNGSNVDELYIDKYAAKFVHLDEPTQIDTLVTSKERVPSSVAQPKQEVVPTFEKSDIYTAKDLLEEHLIHWRVCVSKLGVIVESSLFV